MCKLVLWVEAKTSELVAENTSPGQEGTESTFWKA
jgi:hypothetical protein